MSLFIKWREKDKIRKILKKKENIHNENITSQSGKNVAILKCY